MALGKRQSVGRDWLCNSGPSSGISFIQPWRNDSGKHGCSCNIWPLLGIKNHSSCTRLSSRGYCTYQLHRQLGRFYGTFPYWVPEGAHRQPILGAGPVWKHFADSCFSYHVFANQKDWQIKKAPGFTQSLNQSNGSISHGRFRGNRCSFHRAIWQPFEQPRHHPWLQQRKGPWRPCAYFRCIPSTSWDPFHPSYPWG